MKVIILGNKVYRKLCNVCGTFSEHKGPTSNTCNSCLEKGLKYCNKCNKILPLEAFNKRGYCRKCGSNMSCTNNNARYANDVAYRCSIIQKKLNQYKNDSKVRERHKHYCKLNRYKRRGAEGKHTQKEWEKCVKYFNNSCAYCGATEKLSKDHVIPISKGGHNCISNIVPACRTCNSSKQDRDLQEFSVKEKVQKIIEWRDLNNDTKSNDRRQAWL